MTTSSGEHARDRSATTRSIVRTIRYYRYRGKRTTPRQNGRTARARTHYDHAAACRLHIFQGGPGRSIVVTRIRRTIRVKCFRWQFVPMTVCAQHPVDIRRLIFIKHTTLRPTHVNHNSNNNYSCFGRGQGVLSAVQISDEVFKNIFFFIHTNAKFIFEYSKLLAYNLRLVLLGIKVRTSLLVISVR